MPGALSGQKGESDFEKKPKLPMSQLALGADKMMDQEEIQGFAEMMMTQHPAIQQDMFKCFMACVQMWAKQTEHDLRNEATVKISKRIIKNIEQSVLAILDI